ncbi:ParA family protein [Methyloversatilis discipulorum]|uniref:ParA family protein n=1 Tax=Methyloversatilis discipulorum TaxID=1119528 RepID=UPI001A609BA1|nr:ParA family protein [Methyloversatilis discipulorum]MBL8466839.1 AAA family ATPase [Methyloversatilis discipulorum]
MAVYSIWNNKGGVGKSYLTFQVASEYARTNQDKRVLVIDLCPQANSSSMLLGGILAGETRLNAIHLGTPRTTISGYVEDRIFSPYVNPRTGARYATQVSQYNNQIPDNLFLVVGDDQLELQSSRVTAATFPGPQDAWRIVHTWISDLIGDITTSWDQTPVTVFIDCNPSFSIYTELALSASDRLIVPFSADGSSKRAVRAVLSLAFGVRRQAGQQQSEFFINSERFRMSLPELYMYVGNRLTQANQTSAAAFKTVVNEIGDEIYAVWQANPNLFCIHPTGAPIPSTKRAFKAMFQYEVNDANTASVVSGACGIPISSLSSGTKNVLGRNVQVNQSQLDKQVPNIRALVTAIE